MRAPILILICAILRPQTVPPHGQVSSPKAEESVRRLISSIPSESEWRKMLEQGATGDGIHQPWMDAMTKLHVTLVTYDFEFNWTNGGKKLTNWRLVETRYFADYDRSQPVNNSTLDDIKAEGLSVVLEKEALARAKVGNWVEFPAEQTGTGYRRIVLADNEWLPVRADRWFGQYESGTTPLMHAAMLGQVPRLVDLLQRGADVNAIGPNGSTALVYAASSGKFTTVETLLNAGARTTPPSGGEALITAAAVGNAQILELLLKTGVDPNYRDRDGATALSVAAQHRYSRIVDLLKQAGAHE
jgi:hypothetical protein